VHVDHDPLLELDAVQFNWTWYSSQVARGPGQRAGLTQESVLEAARTLLTELGLDGLTMRALARSLGVAPNALYSHVAGKTELVDALLDDVLTAVEEPPADVADPVAGVAGLMTSTYEVLLAHPDLVPLYLARQGARGPRAVRLGVTMDALLERAGVPSDAVPRARRALIVHAIGSAAFATSAPLEGDSSAPRPLPADESRADFAAALRWLLDGIVRG
jgi:TetR/AcrR family tetracycline transcriptional repressor